MSLNSPSFLIYFILFVKCELISRNIFIYCFTEFDHSKREFINLFSIFYGKLLLFVQTQKPRKFDCELPDISLKDLQFLQSFCPSEVQPFLR